MTEKPDILSLFPEELTQFVRSIGEKDFRAKQLYGWMQKGAAIDEMTNLPAAFREKLKECAEYRLPKIEEKYVSQKDGTVKYLFSLIDGECVESVFMRYEHGNTICVSSQAGCRMGCKFCASTLRGKVRDLTASEILGQVIAAQRDTGERIGGVVMMGIGEPLDNYDNSVRFLRLVSHPDGLNIGLRHISLSTCGLVDKIVRLAEEDLPITLSISLHASDDETRSALMPVNNRWPIAALLGACRDYFARTGRRVSFEYTLIGGKNDSLEGARALAKLLKNGMHAVCHVNLILLNEVAETGLSTVARKNAEAFRDELCRLGVNATIRRRLGSDIDASCGQLRLRHTQS
ncbi:MAG: 23S rRNA (adenine(2503)-C(2))-methyltransferase RlmN [Clostridia bacterium]|nr:23S rRNA (adenine(2503)-C(2))-methyltransferase RlmN [Clostridia bacterium]